MILFLVKSVISLKVTMAISFFYKLSHQLFFFALICYQCNIYTQSDGYMNQSSPSLYETFTGYLPLDVVSEEEQVILSVLDNIQRIFNL